MSSSVSAPAGGPHSPATGRFRVQDNARALWSVMLVALLLGFAVLRLLIGATDTPKVDTSGAAGVTDVPEATLPAKDQIHRLRPQTSSSASTVELTSGEQFLFSEGQSWEQPATPPWNLVPIPQESTDVAQQPDLVR